MIEVETSAASAPERSGLSDLEARAVRAVEACLIYRTHETEMAAGEALARLKGSLKHGAFGAWWRTNLPVSESTIARYLTIYRKSIGSPFAVRRLTTRGRSVKNSAEELRALLLSLSLMTGQALPLAALVPEDERNELGKRAREAAVLMDRLAAELLGGEGK